MGPINAASLVTRTRFFQRCLLRGLCMPSWGDWAATAVGRWWVGSSPGVTGCRTHQRLQCVCAGRQGWPSLPWGRSSLGREPVWVRLTPQSWQSWSCFGVGPARAG